MSNYFNDQKRYETYTPSQMSEILHLLIYKTDLSPSTKKFLGYFRNKKGATKAPYDYICKIVGISDRTWRRTVRSELLTFFGSPIFGVEETQKLTKNRSRKARGCQIKYLLTFEQIKKIVEEFFKQQEEEFSEIPEEFAAAEAMAAAALSGDVSGDVSGEQKAETPSESKAEEPFSHEQKKAFRKEPLKDLKTIFNITGGAFKIKKSIQKFILNIKIPAFKNFMSWSQSKQYAIANTLQLALINSEANIEEESISYPVRNAISACFDKYENKPQEELLKLLYTYVFNRLNPEKRTASEDQSEDLEDRSEDLEPAAAAIQEDQLISPALAAALEAEEKRQAEKNRQEIDEMLRQLRKPAAYLENGQKSPEFEAYCLKESDDLPY